MPSELAAALCAARAEMRGTVYKGGFNSQNKYPYVGHEDVITSGAREALTKHGLALVQTEVAPAGETRGFKDATVLLWRGTYQLLHTSGESLTITIHGTTHPGDKSGYQASTMIDRTVYLRLLALAGSADEDTDHDEADKRRKAEMAAAEAAQKAAGGANGQRTAPAQNGAPQGAQSPAGYLQHIAVLAKEVAAIKTREDLVEWAKQLRRAPSKDKTDKAHAWEAFQKRASELKLDAHAVLKEADDALKAAVSDGRAA